MEPATGSNQNRTKYHLHIDLDRDYAPVCKRSKREHHVSTSDRENLRREGRKHIDLWCDGNLYPINYNTFSTPCFSSPTTLLKFAGDGNNGLLGYCKDLCNQSSLLRSEVLSLRAAMSQKESTIQEQAEAVEALKRQLAAAKTKKTNYGPRQRERKLKNVECLKLGTGGLKRRIQAIRYTMSV